MSFLRKEKRSVVNDTSQQAKKQALSAVDLTNAVLVNFYGEGKTAINKFGYSGFVGGFPSMASIIYNDSFKTIVFDDSLRSAALAKGCDVMGFYAFGYWLNKLLSHPKVVVIGFDSSCLKFIRKYIKRTDLDWFFNADWYLTEKLGIGKSKTKAPFHCFGWSRAQFGQHTMNLDIQRVRTALLDEPGYQTQPLPIRQLWESVLERQKEDVTGLWYCINELVINPSRLRPSLSATWGLEGDI
jgi:hypothetical protein